MRSDTLWLLAIAGLLLLLASRQMRPFGLVAGAPSSAGMTLPGAFTPYMVLPVDRTQLPTGEPNPYATSAATGGFGGF